MTRLAARGLLALPLLLTPVAWADRSTAADDRGALRHSLDELRSYRDFLPAGPATLSGVVTAWEESFAAFARRESGVHATDDAPFSAHPLASEDFDGDGRADVALISATHDDAGFHINVTARRGSDGRELFLFVPTEHPSTCGTCSFESSMTMTAVGYPVGPRGTAGVLLVETRVGITSSPVHEVADVSMYVYALDGSGREVFEYEQHGTVTSTPAGTQVESLPQFHDLLDSEPGLAYDLLISTEDAPVVSALGPTTLQPRVIDGADGGIRDLGAPLEDVPPTARFGAGDDLDGDGRDDVLVTTPTDEGDDAPWALTALSSGDGSQLWHVDDAGGNFAYRPGDVSGDGVGDVAVELLLITFDDEGNFVLVTSPDISVYDGRTGRLLGRVPSEGTALIDLDGDDVTDVLNVDVAAAPRGHLVTLVGGKFGTRPSYRSELRLIAPAAASDAPRLALSGDVDGDGAEDLSLIYTRTVRTVVEDGDSTITSIRSEEVASTLVAASSGRAIRAGRLGTSVGSMDGSGDDFIRTMPRGAGLALEVIDGRTGRTLWSGSTSAAVVGFSSGLMDADRCADVAVVAGDVAGRRLAVLSGCTGRLLWSAAIHGAAPTIAGANGGPVPNPAGEPAPAPNPRPLPATGLPTAVGLLALAALGSSWTTRRFARSPAG